MSRARPKNQDAGPGSVELVEEAVHFLRGTPASAWAIYLAGVTPWLLGLAWFWAFGTGVSAAALAAAAWRFSLRR